MKQFQMKMNSVIGPLYLVASETGLQGVFWKTQNVPKVSNNKILLQAIFEIEEYLSGKRHEFSVPLDIKGSDFQKKVWREISKIPYGQTKSYKEIAGKIKNIKASRAVGTANGKNPLCLIVPCHRVISSDGSLGGYSGGLKIKTKLLNLEQSRPS